MARLVDFGSMAWTKPAQGVRCKAFAHGNQRMRLVEFSEGFEEGDWCRAGHAGYVLEGTFTNDYHGTLERYKAGDSFFIPAGEYDRHKVIMGKGERVLVLLFEVNA